MPRTSLRLVVGMAALGIAVSLPLASLPATAQEPQLTDVEDDAYRVPQTPAGQPEPRPPMPMLSNDLADVLSVSFAAANSPRPDHDRAYSVSVRIPGKPDPGFNYLVGAQFGGDCWLVHYLTPGQSRKALTSCGEGDQARSVGTLAGSVATAKDGVVSATFSYRPFLLPSRLKADRTLGPFFVLTCPSRGSDEWACEDEDLLDWAWSESKWEVPR